MKIQHKTTILAQAISLGMTCAMLCQPCFAMQALEDEHLENITGEGIAFVLNDFNLQFNGADEATGTGYTHLIPVGPLSNMITAHNAATANANGTEAQKSRAVYDIQIGKGDIYFYGLSISGNDGDVNTQFSGNTVNVGSADNPWLIQVKTIQVPNFAGISSDLAYLGIEAPEFTNLVDVASGDDDPNLYDLKIGTWADAFVRDPSRGEGDDEQFWLNGEKRPLSPTDSTQVDRENRLRLQAIINGVSLNGTSVKIFQTLDGAETAAGLGSDYSHYNNTLGLALTARINSGASTSVRAPTFTEGTTISDETTPTTEGIGQVSGWTLLHGGWTVKRSTLQQADDPLNPQPSDTGAVGSCNNGGSVTVSTNYGDIGCQYMVQSRSRTDSRTRTLTKNVTWGSNGLTNGHVIRLSTQEKATPTPQGLLSTPAIHAGAMPTFADNEGLFLYQPNINLILGSQWQPLVLGVADDGKNFSIELTRIPNVANVYKEIYTDYSGTDSDYKGGTCSIYWCGGDGNGISKNATHSSITIGSTNYTAPDNTTGKPLQISAYTGADALGISFGNLAAAQGTTTTATGSNTTYATTTEARYIQRVNDTSVDWRYSCTSDWGIACGIFGSGASTGYINQWSYNGTRVGGITSITDAAPQSSSTRYRYPIAASGGGYSTSSNTTAQGLCPKDTDCTYYSPTNNRNWTVSSMKGLSWSYSTNPVLNNWLARQGSTATTSVDLTSGTTLGNQAVAPAVPKVVPLNAVNLGSAVIDGLLIQHMKITTKGL